MLVIHARFRSLASLGSAMALITLLTAERTMRREQNIHVPDEDGQRPITLSIGGNDMSMSNRKLADWKKILTKAKE